MKRLGTVFHESFALNRPAVAKILELSADIEGGFNREQLRENSNLGTNYVKAMPRYTVGSGFIEDQTYMLTTLGRFVFEHDPYLNQFATLWLMHYHLSAPKGPGPLFWHYLVSQKLSYGELLDPNECMESVRTYLKSVDGTDLADRSARTLITVFVGTYTKEDSLGGLQLIEEAGDDEGKGYWLKEPDQPTVGAVGFALAHYWESVWGQANMIPLSELTQPGGFADLFFLSGFQLNGILRELASHGLLSLLQVAPPHQVSRGWEDKHIFLRYLYE